jgi:hypothetical protein
MNSTGLKLNSQELRNAAWFGEFKTSMYAISAEQLQRWRKWRIFCRLTELLTIFDAECAAPFFETVRNFDTRGSLLIALLCARADAP